jgi:NADH dehydrogenase
MTTTAYKQACIFGGTGFIGRQIVRLLAKQGYTIKVAARAPERAYFLRTAGNVGQIVPFACDYGDDAAIREAVRGCSVVVNCIGIAFEKGGNGFTRIHTELPRAIAKACAAEQVSRLVHLSALGCDQACSKYAKSKRNGEMAVLENYPRATILRPSVVFGVEDNFFNMLARMAVLLPALPLIGGGGTKFQPVYVGDIAEAVSAALETDRSAGLLYELGGPETISLRGIYERVFRETERKKMLVPLPWGLASLQGKMLGLMPRPLLTADQVETLKADSVVSGELPGFAELGLVPTGMDAILPTYLSRYRPGGRFGDKKRA